jgi:hypothetical protein
MWRDAVLFANFGGPRQNVVRKCHRAVLNGTLQVNSFQR